MVDYFNQACRIYHTDNEPQPNVIGKCENCMQLLTDDYSVYTDSESNLFCSKKCALECYGIEEYIY
ncbi:MAG: hypothetical protein GX800_03960 [Clostridiaceae bacterium]|nr:hypothetical protein [Clostridiaceae bacterium]